jgi:hypothetical protein
MSGVTLEAIVALTGGGSGYAVGGTSSATVTIQ